MPANNSRRAKRTQTQSRATYDRRNARARSLGYTSYSQQRRDIARSWHHYEGGKAIKEHRAQYEAFKDLRIRQRIVDKTDKTADEKQAIRNAIMHDYMRQWHKTMSDARKERIVWDFEGDTP